jgi:hypothetical protein
MALTVYTSKDNAWREYVNPLRGMTLERIVQLIEQGERGAFADLQRRSNIWPSRRISSRTAEGICLTGRTSNT